MKKIFYVLMLGLVVLATSCKHEVLPVNINVQLTLDNQPFAAQGIQVLLTQSEATFEAFTDANGVAAFLIPVGTYEANVSFKQSEGGKALNFNGVQIVTVFENTPADYKIPLTKSESNQLIIKECYNGGCMDNDNAKNYANDKYIIVYNNSDIEVDASKLCVAMGPITPTTSSAKYLDAATGKHSYEAEGWCPASYAIWWFQKGTTVKIAPYSQIVISILGAIDHTKTYNNSVDLSHADYCMYDPESGFKLASSYPAPSASIPESHYMKTFVFGMGTAWPFPIITAAPFLILPESDMEAFVKDTKNFDNKGTNNSSNYCKVPQKWVVDALGLFSKGAEAKSTVVFPSNIDAGYVSFENKKGYTIYRNVDKEATEAIDGNKDKLVYGYKGEAYDGAGDPSGIDAEASIANGAKIVYKDTNNSSKDFHVRKVASIKK